MGVTVVMTSPTTDLEVEVAGETPEGGAFREGTLMALRGAERIGILTGSGISAESGIPTFRGADGLWEGVRAEDLASPEGFQRDPEKVWAWYRWRQGLVLEARPNPAHDALAALESIREVTVITQNVDGLHQRAGSQRVLEVHGSILRTRCSREGCPDGIGGVPEAAEGLPRCRCGALLRPAVVWFGESLPQDVLEAAVAEVSRADVVLLVGTSSLVYPAAGLPHLAIRAGVPVIEVNPSPTPFSELALEAIREPAGRCLPALLGAALGPEGFEIAPAD